jgi:ankyrin repeat protein
MSQNFRFSCIATFLLPIIRANHLVFSALELDHFQACESVQIDAAKLSDLYGRTLLHVAARVPDLAAANKLLKLGADVN